MDASGHNLFPVIGPTEMRDYIAVGRARIPGRTTRHQTLKNTMNTEPKPENVQDELTKARAKIAAVERVMAWLQEGFVNGHIYDKLHEAIYSDQWEQSTHDEQRDEIARLNKRIAYLEQHGSTAVKQGEYWHAIAEKAEGRVATLEKALRREPNTNASG